MRHATDFFLPWVPQPSGHAIGVFFEKAEKENVESKYPDGTLLCCLLRAPAFIGGNNQKGEYDMQKKVNNKFLSRILCMMLIVAMALTAVGCNKTDGKETPENVQETVDKEQDSSVEDTSGDTVTGEDADAEKPEDVTELGEGALSFHFSVVDKDGNETKFLIHTDEKTVGAALLEQNLIEGEESQYGLYVKKVNGIVADYDIDATYWAFYVNGEYAMSGVDTTDIVEGESYSFVVSK